MAEPQVDAAVERILAHYLEWKESTFPGLLGNVVAGRIANRLDLGGTNCITDAACASSISALAMAANELYLGDSDLVITGGVDTMNDVFMYMCFSKTPALSPTGDCRPFSTEADGTMLGEGLGMMAIKRLEDAERDGDAVYAVVRGIGASSDGRAKSVYAPLATGQARAIRRAYDVAGFGPDTVELVEAHGTGTTAGDAAEVEGLRTVFEESGRRDEQWCALGSVKALIGHTKAAAGAAGLIKAVLALQHRALPPQPKSDQLNPALASGNSPFYVPTAARPWVRGDDHERRAGVSSFGFGGSNFHVALSEYAGSAPTPGRFRASNAEMVVVCGEPAEVAVSARQMASDATEEGFLRWAAQTSIESYDPCAPARLAIVARDERDLAAKLTSAAERIQADPAGREDFSLPGGVHFGTGGAPGPLAYLFPGQGSHYVGMGSGLAMAFPGALEAWNLAADLDLALHDVVFARATRTEAEREEQARLLTATEWAQPAIGCMSLSMLHVLRELGLEPSALGGHSFGELTALHAAGAIDAADFLLLARRRGEHMRDASGTAGGMLVVADSIESVRSHLERVGYDLVVANHNGPRQVVLSGPSDQIDLAAASLAEAGIRSSRLTVATAFHSPLVAAASEGFARELASSDVARPSLPVYANASATAYGGEPTEIRTELARQLTQPVRFVEMIEAMYDDGQRTFVEVGPSAVLTAQVREILGDRPHVAVSLDRKGAVGIEAFLQGLGTLVALGVPMRLTALWGGYRSVTNPHDRVPSKAAVRISGVNYGRHTPEPMPYAATAREAPHEPTAHQPPQSPIPSMSEAPATPPPPAVTTNGSVQHYGGPPPVTAPEDAVPNGSSAPGAGRDPSTLLEIEREVASTHLACMETLARTHEAYLQAYEATLGQLSGTPRIATPAPRVISQPRPDAAVQPAPPPPPVMAVTPATGPSVVSQPTSSPVVTAEPAQSPQPAVDHVALLLEVVAGKTGYPAEMLTLEMALEGDLGIDSIKRVEILSALRDRLPDLPEVDTSVLAELSTLGHVVTFMTDNLPSSNGAGTPVATTASSPVTAEPAQSPQPAVDHVALLLEVVAGKTGYPAEMLTLEMALEGDLGIDSIKRVEILSALRDRLPDLPEVDTSVLAELSTLGDVVTFMTDNLPSSNGTGTPLATSASSPVGPTVGEPARHDPTVMLRGEGGGQPRDVLRRVLRLIEAPRRGLALHGLVGGAVAVTGEAGALSEELASELSARGIRAAVGDAVPDDVTAVICCAGMSPASGANGTESANAAAFTHAKSSTALLERGGTFVTLQDSGGGFGLIDIESRGAWAAGSVALARTLAKEYPSASVKSLDVQRSGRDTERTVRAIVDELLSGGPDTEVGLTADGRRWVPSDVETDGSRRPLPIGVDDVIVVSGGARGVTAACTVELARASGARFLLVGRSPLSEEPPWCREALDDAALKQALLERARETGQPVGPAELGAASREILAAREIRSTLKAVEDAGGRARYVTADVADPGELETAVRSALTDWGSVTGVVHGAGVLADKLVADKTVEQFHRVFDTKVSGLRALLDLETDLPLRLLVIASSVAARYGNPGQADYAMANQVMTMVAESERSRRPDCTVKAIAWGPWDGGMVTPSLRSHFEQAGVPLLPLDAGARAFVDELASDDPSVQVVLTAGGPELPSAPGTGHRHADVRVSLASDPHLADHAVRGSVVVPFVSVIEWMVRSAGAFWPFDEVELRDLRMMRGLRLTGYADGATSRFVIRATGDTAEARLELLDDEGALRYQCRARHREPRPDDPWGPEPGADLESGPAGNGSAPFGGTAPYGGRALFHGPAFQALERIDGLDAAGACGVVRGLLGSAWPDEPWQTDPLALDGLLQLAVLWTELQLESGSMPTSIAEVRAHRSPSGSRVLRGVVRGRETSTQRTRSDAALLDERGAVVAELIGIECHTVGAGTSE